MDRPSDHAPRLVELVNERGASDVDVDRIGKAYPQFAHLLRAGDDYGVIAGRPGIEERDSVELAEISVGRSIRARSGRVGCGCGLAAHKSHRFAQLASWSRALGAIGQNLSSRAI